ncbi:MAG: sigma-70 family RNA polymerase sigma factor [Planctomycetes bacterium]|nr:sigma-70 family RNA polymerase sigma factor [Planctomycetota bacterium]
MPARGSSTRFPSTHWSEILALREKGGSGYRRGLESLVRAYWLPIYGLIRRRGATPEDAEDLTQSFFAYVLERDAFRNLEREGGKFRRFIRTVIERFLVSDYRRQTAARRAPSRPLYHLVDVESILARPGRGARGADVQFQRLWALTVLQIARNRMAVDCETRGRLAGFEVFDRYVLGRIAGEPAVLQANLANERGLSIHQVKNYVRHGKIAFQKHVRAVLAETVSRPEEVEEELQVLREYLTD